METMRDIGDPRPRAHEMPSEDGLWWFKGLLFVAADLVTLAHFGLQRSYALERAAVGERTLGELVEQTQKMDRLRELDYEQSKAAELERVENYSDKDRAGLAAIIGGE